MALLLDLCNTCVLAFHHLVGAKYHVVMWQWSVYLLLPLVWVFWGQRQSIVNPVSIKCLLLLSPFSCLVHIGKPNRHDCYLVKFTFYWGSIYNKKADMIKTHDRCCENQEFPFAMSGMCCKWEMQVELFNRWLFIRERAIWSTDRNLSIISMNELSWESIMCE